MTTISILGCGWLGMPLGRHLARIGFHVKGSTTQTAKLSLLENAGIQPYHITFDPELVGEATDFFHSDILLINLPPRNKDGVADFHEKQLKAIRKRAKGQIKKVIFISSTAVYPSENKEVTEKDADAKSLSRSGISLLNMEKIFAESPDFEVTVIRFGGLYGPNRHPGRFLAGKKDLSGGTNPVNMIHLDDCIGVIATIIRKNLWGETLNACAPSKETRQSFYEKAARDLGIEAPTFTDQPAPYKKVNAEKLAKLTGYEFKH